MGQNIKSKTRGSKILIVSLSLAASLSGWAWLTLTQTLVDAQVAVAQPPRPSVSNLAQLPVRGLREVESYVSSPAQMLMGGQQSAVSSSQSYPQSKPKPVRRAKASK